MSANTLQNVKQEFMEDEMEDIMESGLVCTLVIFGIILLCVGFIVPAAYMAERPSCYAHWKDSGMEVRWSFFGGCQLRMRDGTWVPDDVFVSQNKNVTVK